MHTTVRSASSGFACVKPRLAVQRTSPFKTKLVLLSSGAFILLATKFMMISPRLREKASPRLSCRNALTLVDFVQSIPISISSHLLAHPTQFPATWDYGLQSIQKVVCHSCKLDVQFQSSI
jgi:hypothetical protein